MIKLTQLALATGLMSLCAMPLIAKEQTLSPAAVIEKSSANEWRSLDLENTLILSLNTGDVVIELNPELAPNHVTNFKKLTSDLVKPALDCCSLKAPAPETLNPMMAFLLLNSRQ